MRHLVRRHGYRVIERHHRNPRGEIDLVAWDAGGADPVLCFVEIKSRADSSHGSAAQAVDEAKQRRVRRAAEVYLQQWQRDGFEIPDCRFDVVLVERRERPPGSESIFRGGWGRGWTVELIRGAFE